MVAGSACAPPTTILAAPVGGCTGQEGGARLISVSGSPRCLLSQRDHLRCAVIMLQREVAERLYASPGTKAYGSLTLLTQWYATVDKGFHVPPSAFSPPPKVMSTVVRIIPRATPPVAVQDEACLFRLMRAAFAQRRKTLANALRHAFQPIEPAILRQTLENNGIAPNRRGETLTLDEFARLSDALQQVLLLHRG